MKGPFGPLTVADPVSEVRSSRTAGVAFGASEGTEGDRASLYSVAATVTSTVVVT
jgi:hypothetical protein